jgi:hypothetical protein
VRRLLVPVGLLLALVLWLASDVRLADPPAARPANPSRPGAAGPPKAAPSTPPLLRDPFRFADEARQSRPEMPPVRLMAEPDGAPAEPAVRLAGFVRRADGLLAVLSVAGDVAVLGAGEAAGGYEVLELDEEQGVRVRTPDGQEITLKLPR